VCDAVTVWRKNGAIEERHPCSMDSEPICSYHRKMKDGLLEPAMPDSTDPKVNVPIRVEYHGGSIWTR